jgi:hypothetical protein
MMRSALLLLLLPILLLAQSDTASLTGQVTDPSGAAVVGAKITLQNHSTGSRRVAVSDILGAYRFSLLVPGPYEITVEAEGFMQYRDNQVVLQVAQTARLDVPLQIGRSTESVEVQTTVSMLNTETVAQGTVVGEEKISSLPLNGRQFMQLTLLVPGANSGGRAVQQNQFRQGMMGGLSVSGGRTNNTAFLLDGITNVDPDYNSMNYSPSVDAIQEFQVQTAMYGAEYGHASGGQVNVVTKSGSNQVHGSAWDFLRNDKLDARPFNLPTATLPKYRRNQYGATLGGPVVKNKLFLFLAYEGLKVRQAGAGLTTVAVPTALQRAGDFSQTKGGIFDPDTLSQGVRQPFSGNLIPPSRMDPRTVAAILAMPLANVPGSTSLFVNSNGLSSQNNGNYSGRIDYVVAQHVTVFGRYSLANERAVIPSTVTGRDGINNVRPQSAVAGATMLLRNDLVNEARFGFGRFRQIDGWPELSFQMNGQTTRLPQFLPAGYPTMGGVGGYAATTGGGIFQVRDNTYQVYDNLSWQHGRHSAKFGAEMLRVQFNRFEAANVLGNFQFTNGFTTRTAKSDGTGDALASMYLALPAVANRSVGPSRIDGRQPIYSFYAQDNLRLWPTLTLNFGLRYELAPPMYDAHQQMSSIDYRNVPSPQAIFAEGKLAYYMPTLFICGQSGYPKGCAYTDYNNFAPRLGVVWAPGSKTVVRAGAGVFYAASDFDPLFRLAAGLPGNIAQTLSSNNYIPQYRGFDIFGGGVVGPAQVQQAGIDINQRTSYSLQWSFTVQRELRQNLTLEAGYLATMGLKLEQNVQPNNAQPGAGAVDPRRPYIAEQYASNTTFPSYLTVVGNSVPVGFINYLPHSAQSNYHAGFLRLEKRFAHGLSWLTAYTYSKAITNAPQFRNAGGVNGSENSPPQDSFNLREERGLAYFDTRHRMVNTFVWDLPFGRDRRFLTSGLASKILGGWQTAGILALQTGFPFTLNLKGDTAGVGAGTGGIYVRPNLVYGADPVLSGSDRNAAHFFNTAAFATPAAFTFGNLGRNTIIGPGLVNLDFTLAKSLRITEAVRVQFRAEAFNFFNHPNFNLVGRIVNDATFGQVQSQLDPRQLQFGVKVIF